MKIYNQYQYSYPHKRDYYPIEKDKIINALQKISHADFYVHIPFCSTKCGYCNLFSKTSSTQEEINLYLNAIKRQYEQIKSIKEIISQSLVLGGGTPILLSLKQFDFLFSSMNINPQNHYSIIEISPNDTSKEKIKYLKDIGFNRVSIGVQSFNKDELKKLLRGHSVESCHKALEILACEDFENLNVDLIYGIKGQTEESLKETLSQTLKYNPHEIFIYPLYMRENTRIYNTFNIDEQHTQKLYFFLKDFLINQGYTQISMRRFVKENKEDFLSCGFSHNLSFGCGGRSYLKNIHISEQYKDNKQEINTLLGKFYNKEDFLENLVGYELNLSQVKHRYIVKNLLHLNGISCKDYTSHFNTNIYDDYSFFKEKNYSEYLIHSFKSIKLKDFSFSDCIVDLILENEGLKNGHF